MATLPGQRAQFTWALRQYNLAENEEKKEQYARHMTKYIAAAPANGFTVEQITRGQLYPEAEINRYINEPAIADQTADLTEIQALQAIQGAVDITDFLRMGEGNTTVYAYGYRCAPDRLKIGKTIIDTVQRITAQIGTGTPDKPSLFLEIKTHDCHALERAIHEILEYRGVRIHGAGQEWFMKNRIEVVEIYKSVANS
jgi:hypothetical protein